jgi:hypothetical protein
MPNPDTRTIKILEHLQAEVPQSPVNLQHTRGTVAVVLTNTGKHRLQLESERTDEEIQDIDPGESISLNIEVEKRENGSVEVEIAGSMMSIPIAG